MKKILQISNYFYPNIGGIEQVARDIANTLSKQNDIQQKIICFNENATSDDFICKRNETVHETIDGVEVIRCGCFTKVASQSLSTTYGKELDKLMNDFQPDVVIFHYPNPFVAMHLLKYRKKNFKLVLYWHLDITKQKTLKHLFHGQNCHLIEWADIIVATSPNYIKGSEYLKNLKSKCIVIPNCVNTDRMSMTSEIKKDEKKIRQMNIGKIICFGIGRHIPYKGYEYLIRAAKYLDNTFQIYIGGSGELTESLKEMAREYKNIHFLGRIDDNMLKAYMDACDIYCFPSITKNEAFGISLAEGMYFGKPAVTFTIPGSGVNYVNLNGVTGIECPNADSRAYAMALKKLAEHQELRKQYGENARKRVLENFTYDIFQENILKLINSL